MGKQAKSRGNSISDESIVAALISCKTQRAAAAALGVDERTIYNRMNNPGFMVVYKAAKADMLRTVVLDMNAKLIEAARTIAGIMADESNNPAIRLQAAQTIINSSSKFTAQLQESENSIASDLDRNAWGF